MPCDVLTQHPLLEQVYEAAGGRGQVDVPRPPSKRLTQVLQLLTESCLDTFQRRRQQREEDASQGRRQVFEECSRYMDEAIAVADAQHLILVAADCRLLKARVVTDLASRKEMAMAEEERDSLLDWVIRHPSEVVCPARRARARALKSSGFISAEEKRAAIQAVMRAEGRANPAAHLFECPNGHEYWVGECGGAMQEGRCVECGLGIGGRNHTLADGNRQAAAARAFA